MQKSLSTIALREPIANTVQKYAHFKFSELPPAVAATIEQVFQSILVDSELDSLTLEERVARDKTRGFSEIALKWNASTAEQRLGIAVAVDENVRLQTQYASQNEEKKLHGRMTLREVADELEKQSNISSARWLDMLEKEIKAGELPLKNNRNYSDPLPWPVPADLGSKKSRYLDNEQVQVHDVNAWLAKQSDWGDYQISDPQKDVEIKAGTLIPNAPAVKGLTTAQVVEGFGELVKFNLGKAMTDRAAWTNDARITSGTKGGKHKSLWSPVIMAIALSERNKAPIPKLNRAFHTHKFLTEWIEDWNKFSSM